MLTLFNEKIRAHYIYLGLLALFIGFLLIFISSTYASHKLIPINGPSNNLINGQDWAHFAGATQTDGLVHIDPLGRAIVNQDGSGGQPNPPVNVRGPHLSVRGNFEIDAVVANIPASGPASLYFYSKPPVIYDEWRYEPAQIRLDIYQNKITASLWTGNSDTYRYQKTWTADMGAQPDISLIYGGKTIFITANGKKLGSISGHSIFKDGQVWFGADAPTGSNGWDLESLAVKGSTDVQAGAVFKVTSSDDQSLRLLSSNGSRTLPIGAAVASYALFSDAGYRNLVGGQFNVLTPENELKSQFIHPQPNVYSFAEADSLVDFAAANNMTVHGHNLVFSEANPKWMQNAPLEQRQKIMTDHITTVVSHFGPKINEWDVVDEPLNNDDNNNGNSSDLRQNIWLAAMGEKYIDTAFAAAHTANPSAALYLNEYGIEVDGSRWDEFLSLVKRLQARGVPINGVGFQAHIYEPGDEVDRAVLESHIKTLANMGLKSRISELDAYGDSAQHQADQYTAVLKACLNQPTCTSFNTWGISDKYGSTTNAHDYPLSYGNDLLWDLNLQPKLAYTNLKKAFKTP